MGSNKETLKQKQKQPPEVFCKKRCSQKFHKTHWKTPAPDLFFNKVQA